MGNCSMGEEGASFRGFVASATPPARTAIFEYMTVTVSSQFPCDRDTVVDYVNRFDTLAYISHPLLKFTPVDPADFPFMWEERRYIVSMRILGMIPFGRQVIGVEKVRCDDPEEYIIRDNGSGDLVQTWDHWIFIRTTDDRGLTGYTDRIEIKAGLLTIPVWIFAQIFYRWRQRRWRRLIRNSFQPLAAER